MSDEYPGYAYKHGEEKIKDIKTSAKRCAIIYLQSITIISRSRKKPEKLIS